MTIQFGTRKIGDGQPVFIIAEIGVNHEGDFEVCKKMVEESAKAGADAIKLQTVDPDENYVEGHVSWELFRTCELTKEETLEIFRITRELGMEPFTTSPDIHTLNWVDKEGQASGHKISSGMMTNDIIVEATGAINKPILISTGLGTTEQIDHAVALAKQSGNPDIALFQCTSQYPATFDTLNLATMKWMANRYGLPVGFSDHSKGIKAAIVAAAMGAVMIEKHVTLTPGRVVEINGQPMTFDHHIGLDFDEFAQMVEGIRRAESMSFEEIAKEIPEAQSMVGTEERHLSEALIKQAAGMSRCLVVRQPIKAGEVFTEDNVALKRPFADKRGLEPYEYKNVLGKIAAKNMNIDMPIQENDVINSEIKTELAS